MWRRKKVIIIALLAAVLLAGGISGAVLAADNGADDQPKTVMARVAEILEIDQQQLEDAFAQAKSEMRDDGVDRFLEAQVAEGNITEEEAAQYREWLQAKPDMEPFRQQLEEWQDDMPDMPLFERFGGHGLPGGMMRGGGHCFGGK